MAMNILYKYVEVLTGKHISPINAGLSIAINDWLLEGKYIIASKSRH